MSAGVFGGRRAARFHSLNDFAQPAAESARAVGARAKSHRSSDSRTKQRIAEDDNEEIAGSEQRLFQIR